MWPRIPRDRKLAWPLSPCSRPTTRSGANTDLGPGGLQDAVEPAEQDERQDDTPVLGPLVVAAQQIGDGPDEARVVVGRGVDRGGVRGGAGLGQVVPPGCVTVLPYSIRALFPASQDL